MPQRVVFRDLSARFTIATRRWPVANQVQRDKCAPRIKLINLEPNYDDDEYFDVDDSDCYGDDCNNYCYLNTGAV